MANNIRFARAFFCAVTVFSGIFLGAAVHAAAGSNYGWTLIRPGSTTSTCGSFAYMSTNPAVYTNSTAITVGNNIFTIKRMSDDSTVATYNGTSQAGPGCFDNCNYYYTVDLTGNATYPDFGGSWANDGSCGTAAKRVYTRIHLNPLSSGMDFQQLYPINQWVKVDPQFQVKLINYPATLAEPGGVTYTLTNNIIVVATDLFGGVKTTKTYTYSGGKATYTLPARGLSDGQHSWKLSFYNTATSAYGNGYVPSGSTVYMWFGLDRAVPVVNSYSVTPAAPYTTDSVTINAAVTDVLSGLSDIKIYLDGNLKTTCTLSGQTTQQACSYAAGMLVAGSHTYYVTGTDRAGNTVTATAKSFGVTAAPTITATFSATPVSGTITLASALKTTVTGGTATGNINYYFWTNCNNACTTLAACTTACGAPTASYTNQAATSYTYNASYATAGTYYPRGVAVRQSVETGAGATVTASVPTITATISVAPTSGNIPLSVTISAGAIGGTATGGVDYIFYPNCNSSCATYAACNAVCSAVSSESYGVPPATYTKNYVYTSAGIFYPRLVIQRQGVSIAGGDTVTAISADADPQTSNETRTITTDYCSDPPNAIFNWIYSDAESQPQTAYEVQIIDETKPDFSVPTVDSGQVAGNSSSWATASGQLGYDHTYRWRVKVWDSTGDSDWTEGASFSTPEHKYPKADFTHYPSMIPVDGKMVFTDASVDYSGGGITSWYWTFENGEPATSSNQNLDMIFTNKGNNTVTLTVTDADGYQCTASKLIRTLMRLPIWEEEPPQ